MSKTRALTGVQAVLEAFRRAVGEDATVSTPDRDVGEPYRVDLRVGHRRHRLKAHWVGRGWPSRTREVAARLRRPWPRSHILVAERFSDSTRDVLRALDANWVDTTGAARIATKTGLIVRSTGNPELALRRADSTLRWTSGVADVAELLLACGQVPSLKEVASLTRLHLSSVGKAVRLFDREGWTRKAGSARGRGARRELTDVDELRDAWAAYVGSEPRVEFLGHALMRDPLAFVQTQLAPALGRLGDYAISGWAGAQLLTPVVTTFSVVHAYVGAEVFNLGLRDTMRRLEVREVHDGARLVIWSGRPAVFVGGRASVSPKPVRVAHPNRLYADLLTLGDRGRDAAEHVRLELMGSSPKSGPDREER